MQDNTHSLQFLYKPTVVDTRKDAMKAIYRLFAANSLVAEPYVVFYKDDQEAAPNAIIALGTPVENEVFVIDTKLDKELIEKQIKNLEDDLIARIEEVDEKEAQDIEKMTASLSNLREELTSRIDDLTKTVEANEVFVGKTDTIVLKKENQVITGEVIISKEGANSKSVIDDNIVVNQNGIYAAVDMKLEKNKLKLITSGYDDNGIVQTDVVKREIDLSEILLEISPSEYNILRLEDGKLYVDGRAKNLIYKKTTVADALNKLEDKVDTLQELDVKVNRDTNVLSITVGETTKEVTLPGLDLVDRVEYNKANHEILIIFKDGSKAPINMLEVLSTFKFIDTNTIDLSAELGSQGGIRVSGDVKVSTRDDNALRKVDDGLFVDKDEVTGATMADVEKAVEEEKNRAEREETSLATAIEKESVRATNRENEIATVADNAKADVDTLKQDFTALHEDYTNHKAQHEVEFNDLSEKVATNKSDISDLKGTAAEFNQFKASHEVESGKMSEAIDANKTKIAEVETNANNTKIELGEYKASHTAECEAINSEYKAADAVLAGKLDETKADLATTKEQVAANKDGILNEVTRAQLAEKELADRVTVTEKNIDTLNGGVETPDSVRFIVKHFIELLEATVNTEITRSTAADELFATQLRETYENLVSQIADTNNTSVANMTAAIEAEAERAKGAEANLQTAIDNHNSVAQEYTDNKINEVKLKVTANEEEIAAIKENVAKKVENVALVKNSENDLEYNLLVDEKLVGQINIPKDNLLEEVTYDSDTHILRMVFTVGKDNAQQVVPLNLSDLVDVYLAGNGLVLHGNVFSIQYNAEGDEGYLKIDENGICVKGIDAKLNEKANAADVYTKAEVYTQTEADGKFITEHQSLDEYAKTADVEKVYATKEEISGFANTEAVDGLTAIVAEHTTTLTIINGNEAEEGSIKKALRDAKAYTDEKVVEENEKISQLDNKVNEGLASKANIADVYTKAEIDANNFLTDHQDLSHLATKESVNAVDEQVKTNTTAIALLNDIEGREGSVANTVAITRNILEGQIAEKANSIDVYTKTEADSKFRSEIKLVGANDTALAYTLMVDGVACGQINIPKDNFVKSVIYDPALKSLKFVYELQSEGGMESSIIVPVGDFVETYLAGAAIAIDAENKISVKRSIVSEKYLSVTDEGIAIIGVDAELNDIKNVINSVGADVESNKARLNEIEKAINEVNFINGGMTDSVEVKVVKSAGHSQFDVNANVRVSGERKNMITVKSDGLYAVTPICDAADNMIQNQDDGLYVSNKATAIKLIYKGEEKDVQTAFSDLSNTVNEVLEHANQVMAEVNTLKTEIETLKADKAAQAKEIETLKESVAKMQEIIDNLIDFGTYSEEDLTFGDEENPSDDENGNEENTETPSEENTETNNGGSQDYWQ